MPTPISFDKFETAPKLLSNEDLVLHEQKMDMALDDIIKMSKTDDVKFKYQRVPNKGQRFFRGNQEDKLMKIHQYMDSQSDFRQRSIAQRRSNFQGNSFPLATKGAQQKAVAPFHHTSDSRNRVANWNKPRPAGPMRRQGNPSNGGHVFKKKQTSFQTSDTMSRQKPKTLDSLFAHMKEQRTRAFTHTNNGGGVNVGHRGRVGNQHIQPWLRSRFGNYRN